MTITKEQLKEILGKYNAEILNKFQDEYLMQKGPGCEQILFPVLEKALEGFSHPFINSKEESKYCKDCGEELGYDEETKMIFCPRCPFQFSDKTPSKEEKCDNEHHPLNCQCKSHKESKLPKKLEIRREGMTIFAPEVLDIAGKVNSIISYLTRAEETCKDYLQVQRLIDNNLDLLKRIPLEDKHRDTSNVNTERHKMMQEEKEPTWDSLCEKCRQDPNRISCEHAFSPSPVQEWEKYLGRFELTELDRTYLTTYFSSLLERERGEKVEDVKRLPTYYGNPKQKQMVYLEDVLSAITSKDNK